MRKINFTAAVSAEFNCQSASELWAAICQAVPQVQRRGAAGYKVIGQEPIGGDARHQALTIQVTYR